MKFTTLVRSTYVYISFLFISLPICLSSARRKKFKKLHFLCSSGWKILKYDQLNQRCNLLKNQHKTRYTDNEHYTIYNICKSFIWYISVQILQCSLIMFLKTTVVPTGCLYHVKHYFLYIFVNKHWFKKGAKYSL